MLEQHVQIYFDDISALATVQWLHYVGAKNILSMETE